MIGNDLQQSSERGLLLAFLATAIAGAAVALLLAP